MQHMLQLLASRSPRVVVVGDLMLDRYVWGDAERVSPEAPVLVLRADECEVRPGGAASVAHLAAHLGARVTLLGVVGKDADGHTLQKLLKEGGIDAMGVACDVLRPTTCKERLLARADGRHPQQILRVDRESQAQLDVDVAHHLQSSVRSAISAADVVLIADYGKGVCSEELLADVTGQARRREIPVIVDPTRLADYQRYRGATIVKPNRLEASLVHAAIISGPADAMCAAGALCARFGFRNAVVTLDRDGMVVGSAHGGEHFPAEVKNVYDITGAGDTVLAILGLSVAARLPVEQAARLANVAAGLQLERWGVAPISWDEIRRDMGRWRTASDCKIVTLAELARSIEEARGLGRRVVFTNGCFDLLHVGHVAYLQEAAALGDLLIVAINSDASVRRLKGSSRPVIPATQRAAMLAGLACVDQVIVFEEDTPHKLLELLRPDVLVKGGTYSRNEVVGREVVERYGGRVEVVGLVDGVSTTRILDAVKEKPLVGQLEKRT